MVLAKNYIDEVYGFLTYPLTYRLVQMAPEVWPGYDGMSAVQWWISDLSQAAMRLLPQNRVGGWGVGAAGHQWQPLQTQVTRLLGHMRLLMQKVIAALRTCALQSHISSQLHWLPDLSTSVIAALPGHSIHYHLLGHKISWKMKFSLNVNSVF